MRRAQSATQRGQTWCQSKINIPNEGRDEGMEEKEESECWMEDEDRRASGREFQIVGAAKAKERRAWADSKNDTTRRC